MTDKTEEIRERWAKAAPLRIPTVGGVTRKAQVDIATLLAEVDKLRAENARMHAGSVWLVLESYTNAFCSAHPTKEDAEAERYGGTFVREVRLETAGEKGDE